MACFASRAIDEVGLIIAEQYTIDSLEVCVACINGDGLKVVDIVGLDVITIRIVKLGAFQR